VELETTIPAIKLLQNDALDRAATGTSAGIVITINFYNASVCGR
jgi:hypothetical protein